MSGNILTTGKLISEFHIEIFVFSVVFPDEDCQCCLSFVPECWCGPPDVVKTTLVRVWSAGSVSAGPLTTCRGGLHGFLAWRGLV